MHCFQCGEQLSLVGKDFEKKKGGLIFSERDRLDLIVFIQTENYELSFWVIGLSFGKLDVPGYIHFELIFQE